MSCMNLCVLTYANVCSWLVAMTTGMAHTHTHSTVQYNGANMGATVQGQAGSVAAGVYESFSRLLARSSHAPLVPSGCMPVNVSV